MYNTRPAAIKERGLAYIIDFVIIALAFYALLMIVINYDYDDRILLAVPALYLLKDVFNGRSPGKVLMRLQVKDQQDAGLPVPIHRLVLRNILMLFWPLEFIAMLLSTSNQKIGDRLSGTVVVKLYGEDGYYSHAEASPQKSIRHSILEGDHELLAEQFQNLSEQIDEEDTQKANVGIGKASGMYFSVILGIIAAIFIIVIMMIKSSGAYEASIEAIESSAVIEESVGTITGYGMVPTGSFSAYKTYSKASLNIRVIGTKGSVRVYCYSLKSQDEDWVVKTLRVLP